MSEEESKNQDTFQLTQDELDQILSMPATFVTKSAILATPNVLRITLGDTNSKARIVPLVSVAMDVKTAYEFHDILGKFLDGRPRKSE